jgi:hypothetical protein
MKNFLAKFWHVAKEKMVNVYISNICGIVNLTLINFLIVLWHVDTLLDKRPRNKQLNKGGY